MTLKITSEMVDDLNIDFETSNKWMEEAMMHKADSILPPKISMGPSEGSFINVMPCVLGGRDLQVAGLKVVTRYPGRTPSLDSKMVLMDATNGDYLAIIDADWITSRRTGAVAAHTISLFAKKDYATMGIIGLGECAKSTLHSLRSRDNRHLVVKLFKYKSQELGFMDEFKDEDIEFQLCDTYDEVVKGSDVVVSAVTYAGSDFCTDDCFDEGVLVVPVHTRGFGNCDLFFDKVFMDDEGHICKFRYFDRFRYKAEVSDVVRGDSPGRENDSERILAYNVGIALYDVYYAKKIYDLISDGF